MMNLSNKIHNHLRLGVMCRGTIFQAWEALCLEKLLNSETIDLVLLIIDNDNNSSKNDNSNFLFNMIANTRHLFWYMYYFLYVNKRSKALHPIDLSSTLKHVPSILCKISKEETKSHFIKDDDIAKIRQYNLDFILNFESKEIHGKILEIPHFGIWSFNHSDQEKYRGEPAGFWEIYKGEHATGAILERLNDNGGIILRKGLFKTNRISYVNNLDCIFFGSIDWPSQVCIDIQNGNVDYINSSPIQPNAPIFHLPTNIQIFLFFAKTIRNITLRIKDILFFVDCWNVGIIYEPINHFLQPGFRSEISWMPIENNGFIADPFALRKGKMIHIFFEHFIYSQGKANISTINVSDKLPSKSKVAIDPPYHISYPYLLEYGDQIYCIPETHEAREISLYRAEIFPTQWTKIASIVEDFEGVDSTIFNYGDHWWLFTADHTDGPNHKLMIWHSSDLLGQWMPHANNPVKVDISSARPAGTPFMHNGQLYRPSQDCSNLYGEKIVLNRIKRLTPTEFEEERVITIYPLKNSPFKDGIHTISMVDDTITLIDGFQKAFICKNLNFIKAKIYTVMYYIYRWMSRNMK